MNDFALGEVGENGGEVARPLQHRAGRQPQRHAELVGDDDGQRGLAEPGRAVQAARDRAPRRARSRAVRPARARKTTLHVIANELGVSLRSTAGPVLEQPGDLAGHYSANLAEREVLFIDEIHRMPPAIEEILYPAMDAAPTHHRAGAGRRRIVKVPLPALHPRRCNNAPGLLTSPLRSRFATAARRWASRRCCCLSVLFAICIPVSAAGGHRIEPMCRAGHVRGDPARAELGSLSVGSGASRIESSISHIREGPNCRCPGSWWWTGAMHGTTDVTRRSSPIVGAGSVMVEPGGT